MLRIIQNTSAGGAMNYFTSADYFSEGQELAGRWHGRAAAMLGLRGEVQKSDWDAMCNNLHPQTGDTLTQRQKENRRVGYDFNFRAPKGVSLLYGMTGDQRLLDAFRSAVDETMRDMEAEVQTRVRKDGMDEDRTTANLAWGEWVHFTSRPVDGIPDPHLHAHCFAFNTTWDPSEKRWKAGQFAGLKRDAPYFEAKFHSRLARNLGDLGLEVARARTGWDLAGVPRDLQLKFSRRMAMVEAAAKAKGVVDPELKMGLSAQTREKKRQELSLPELRRQWAEWMMPEEADAIDRLRDQLGTGPVARDDKAAGLAAELACQHVFERKAVVPERTLLREALKRSLGQASVAMTEDAVARRDLLTATRDGRKVVTTREVLQEEQKMIDFARKGRGTCRPIQTGSHSFADARLNDQQRAAVLHLLQSPDRVMVVRGAAGTGKTTMMTEAVGAMEAAGTRVLTFAPSADASRGVLRSEGFETADTVARLLQDEKLQQTVKGGVLWIDEAGLLGTKTLKQVFDLADRQQCRVVLSGDRRQHGSVERGAALRLLETEAGILPAEIRQIQRQDGAYRSAVEDLSAGLTEVAFEKLDRLGWIRQLPREERKSAIAGEYVAAIRKGQTALVVSPTHAEGERLSTAIRGRLQAAGMVSKEEQSVLRLTNLQLTQAERADAASYQPGDVLVFHQNAKGYQKGERITVGETALPLDQAARFTVYRGSELPIAPGDRIRITANSQTVDGKHRLNNGATYRVKGFTRAGALVLDNEWKVARDFGHLSHAYVSTSHASQGKTVDKVILGQSAESLAAGSREQFYVSVSRGRKQAVIFTDDKEALLAAVRREEERLAATDLFRQPAMRVRVLTKIVKPRPNPTRSRDVQREALEAER
jgi:conjugative relaxase-like TrwC/TraI family protein